MTADRPRGGTVLQGGRPKAYRPMPAAARRTALEAGLAAYRRGDYFEAHELLEPAWMGSADPSERELHQGLIKLAAAHVHAIRGNRLGVRKNLAGARSRLAAVTTAPEVGDELDVPALLREVDDRLARLHDPSTTLESLLSDPPTVRRRPP